MTNLDDFIAEADKRSPFIKWEEGIPVEGVYGGAKLVENTFKPGEKNLEYTLEVDGVKKTFKSGSANLARLFKSVKEGDRVEVVRTGQSFKTQWFVTKK